jgi:hypothetical protein
MGLWIEKNHVLDPIFQTAPFGKLFISLRFINSTFRASVVDVVQRFRRSGAQRGAQLGAQLRDIPIRGTCASVPA